MKVFLNPLVRSILYFPVDHQQARLHGQEVESLVTPPESDKHLLEPFLFQAGKIKSTGCSLVPLFLAPRRGKAPLIYSGSPLLVLLLPAWISSMWKAISPCCRGSGGWASSKPPWTVWLAGWPVSHRKNYMLLSLGSTVSYPVTGDT